MLKRIIAAFMTVAIIMGMAGCTTSDKNGVLNSKQNSKQKINFWTHYTNMKELQIQLIDEFNAQNSDVEIVVNMIGDKYGDVLNMAMSSDEAPDVFTIQGPSLTKKAVNLGWAEPLDSYITPEFKALFKEGVFVENNNMIGGKIYTLPDQVSTYRMIYNKDLFTKAGLDPEKPPKTFSEFREYAKLITQKGGNGVKGFILALGDAYQLDVSLFNGMGNYSLGTLHGYDYAKGSFDYFSYKPAIELIRNIRKDGSMQEGELLLKPDQARIQFAEGKIGIMGSVSWETAQLKDLAPNFEIGIANWPTVDGAPRGKNSIQLGSGFAMFSKAKNKEAAWKVLHFLASPDFTGKINKAAGTIGVFTTDGGNGEYANQYVKGFLPNESDAVWPAIVPSLKLQGDNRSVLFTRLITDENADLDKELSDLNKRTNEAFQKAIDNKEFDKQSYIKDGFNPLNLKN